MHPAWRITSSAARSAITTRIATWHSPKSRWAHMKAYTYFIIENEENESHRIKIGFSKKPSKRIKTLQTGNSRKFALMGWIECTDKSLERDLQSKYHKNKLNGEWFSIEPCDVLKELKFQGTSSFICVQSNVGAFLGCDRDAVPEYLGPWEWLDTEIDEFCPPMRLGRWSSLQ
ncbi:hypothetical protein D9M68_424290 [compost metagenome]